jgi:hypothetical protein
MPIPKDYRDLLNALVGKTDDGRVNWRADSTGVEVGVDDSKVAIWAGTDERTDEGFVAFALKDLAGKTVDSWYVDAGDEHYDFMNLFFLSAKRQALGIPDRIAKLKDSILNATTVGDPKTSKQHTEG